MLSTNSEIKMSASTKRFFQGLRINGKPTVWRPIGECEAEADWHETVVRVKGDVVKVSSRFRAKLHGYDKTIKGCNITIVELDSLATSADVGDLNLEIIPNETGYVDAGSVAPVPTPSEMAETIARTLGLKDHVVPESNAKYWIECECEKCGAPLGVRSVTQVTFSRYSGTTYSETQNHTEQESGLNSNDDNYVKMDYGTCSSCCSHH